MNAGTYRTTDAVQVLLWDPTMEKSYADDYRKARAGTPAPTCLPLPCMLKANVEFAVEYGSPRMLISDVGESKAKINALDVTITVGAKVYKGITLVYNDSLPSPVHPASAVRQVKKRKQ